MTCLSKLTHSSVVCLACEFRKRSCTWSRVGLACDRCTYERGICFVVNGVDEESNNGTIYPYGQLLMNI